MDMSYWNGIQACGLDNQNKANLAYFLEDEPSMDAVTAGIVKSFGTVFGYEMLQTAGVARL